ncbi:response regulator [Bradyrhizobium sp. ARR65]|uniref:response regulator transcription factor n=1 Tax=Bradyrhizobium sp. ARR65 TaxID=1040989 RepID=UPI00046485A8|nr:response regulator [Bradyrhizobium sp. ARR65]
MISIIDDDASVRAAVENLLSSLGYLAYSFGSAEEFLQSERLHDTECVIADINMPVVNGFELLVRFRELGKGVPFIFITAFPDEAISEKILSAEATWLLTKPFEKDSLIQKLESALLHAQNGGSGD